MQQIAVAALLLASLSWVSAGPCGLTVDPRVVGNVVSPIAFGANCETGPITVPGLKYPLCRWGGDATSMYNWKLDQGNQGNDWYFVSQPWPNDDPSQLPAGNNGDRWAQSVTSAGIEGMLTIPTINMIGCPGNGQGGCVRQKATPFSVAKYGAQNATECTGAHNASWCCSDCGNGVWLNGSYVLNDPADAATANSPAYQAQWLQHIGALPGTGALTRVQLDNEPMLWHFMHRDVHPQPMGYDELWNRTLLYGAALRAARPDVKIHGPVTWGWCDLWGSAQDKCTDGPDRAAHGGTPIVQWWLQKVAQHYAATGVKLIDALDIHWYPQADGVTGSDESAVTVGRRLRSPLALYNRSYVDESWINQPIALIPLLRGWIAAAGAQSLGLELSISEYTYGSDSIASAALAHADVLGIFGREGVQVGARWGRPAANSRVEQAYRLYVDYDGAGASVTGAAVAANSTDTLTVSVYAFLDGAQPGQRRLRVVLVNKDTAASASSLTIFWPPTAGRTAATVAAKQYQFSNMSPTLAPAGAVELLCPPTSASWASTTTNVQLPGWSATLLDVPLDGCS